jgi:hypothetical protein
MKIKEGNKKNIIQINHTGSDEKIEKKSTDAIKTTNRFSILKNNAPAITIANKEIIVASPIGRLLKNEVSNIVEKSTKIINKKYFNHFILFQIISK